MHHITNTHFKISEIPSMLLQSCPSHPETDNYETCQKLKWWPEFTYKHKRSSLFRE